MKNASRTFPSLIGNSAAKLFAPKKASPCGDLRSPNSALRSSTAQGAVLPYYLLPLFRFSRKNHDLRPVFLLEMKKIIIYIL